MNKFEYKRLCPFKWYILENFPFIEYDFDALTNWQLFCKIGKEINKIRESENTVGTQVEDLTNAFISLQDYINNYFENLDVQDEINNKLDEMVKDGTLQTILNNSIGLIQLIDTVADLISSTVYTGQTIETKGYYSIDDGGKAKYRIVTTSNYSIDGSFAIQLNNGLIAELIIENDTVNFLQLGAKRQDSDGLYDNKQYIDRYIANKNNYKSMLKLYIPGGVFGFSPTILTGNNINIVGNSNFHVFGNNQTILVPLQNQDFIWSIGDGSTNTEGFNIDKLYFSSYNYSISNNQATVLDTYKNVNKNLIFNFATFGTIGKVYFINIKGIAFDIFDSYELHFDTLNFRRCDNINGSILVFDNTVTNKNISACIFDKLIFESIHGNLIEVKNISLYNSTIRDINFEDFPYQIENYVVETLNADIISQMNDNNTIHNSIIKLSNNSKYHANIINNINLNNYAFRTTIFNNFYYIYDVICEINNSNCEPIINNIVCQGANKDIFAVLQTATNNNYTKSFTLNNVVNNTTHDFILNFIGYNKFVGNPRLNKFTDYNSLPQSITPFYINNLVSTSSKPGNIHYDSKALNPMRLVLKGETTGDRNIARIVKQSDTLMVRCRPSDPTLQSRITVNGNKNKIFPANTEYTWDSVDLTGIDNGTVMTVSNGTAETNPILIDCYYFV